MTTGVLTEEPVDEAESGRPDDKAGVPYVALVHQHDAQENEDDRVGNGTAAETRDKHTIITISTIGIWFDLLIDSRDTE